MKTRKGFIAGSALHKKYGSPVKQTLVGDLVKGSLKEQVLKKGASRLGGAAIGGAVAETIPGIAAIGAIGTIKKHMAEDDFTPKWKQDGVSWRDKQNISKSNPKIKKILNPKNY